MKEMNDWMDGCDMYSEHSYGRAQDEFCCETNTSVTASIDA